VIVLAFDQAPLHTGFAWGEDTAGTKPTWGIRHFASFGENEDRLYLAYRKWLAGLFDEVNPGFVFWEQMIARNDNTATFHAQFAVWAAIMSTCADRGIPQLEIVIAQWRKRALGNPKRPAWAPEDEDDWLKKAAIKACADLDWFIDNHNIAEAALQWDFGCACTSTKYMEATEARVARVEIARQQKDRAFKEKVVRK